MMMNEACGLNDLSVSDEEELLVGQELQGFVLGKLLLHGGTLDHLKTKLH